MGDISKDIQSNFPNNRVKAIINIKYTANWLNSHEIMFFKPFGISPQQYNILRILRGAGKAIKVQQVKERMVERAPNATRMIDKLLEKRLVKRARSDTDRRVVNVKITNLGLNLLDNIDLSQQPNFFSKLSESEAKILSDLLDKIR